MQCLKLALVVGISLIHASEVTPVQKVISMMEKMMDKGRTEMEEEKKSYAEYAKFAEKTSTEKARAIDEASEKIQELEANIDKAASDVDRLSAEIAEHDSVIDATSAEKENATSVRQKEAADFGVALKDYDDSIKAIGKAMTVLKEQPNSRPAALLQIAQLDRKLSPVDASKYLDDFLKGREAATGKSLLAESQMPEAAGYEFQSGGVVDLLEKLEDQFKGERNTLKMEELKKKNSFTTLVAGLDSENSDATKDKERKLQEKGQISEQKAKDQSELEETKALMAEDSKYKKDLEMTWKQKSIDFKNTQKLRAEELEAIQKATEIIGGSSVAGSAEKHLPSLLDRTGTALAALKGHSLKKVAQLLQDSAAQLGSQQLAALAQRVTADPIDKVKEMIQSMVTRMEDEAAASATKFQWCQDELSQNEGTRDEKTDEVEKLEGQIEKSKSSIQMLGKDVVSLKEQIKESQEAMAEATEIRSKEKKENTVAIKDAKAAQAAVAEALSVLNEFYAKASASLVQTNAPYQGMGAESGGVIGMIEVIQADFARLEAETSSNEKQSAKEFETFMEDSKLDVASKEKDVEHKTARKESESQKATMLQGDLQTVQKELDAALKTYEQLKPQCADAGASYTERKAKRDAEIKSLEQALEALKIAR